MFKKKSLIITACMMCLICLLSISAYAATRGITSAQLGPVTLTGTIYTWEDYDSVSYAYGRTGVSPNSGIQSAYVTVKLYSYQYPSNPQSTTANYTGSSLMTTSTLSVNNGTHATSTHNAVVVSGGVTYTLTDPLSITENY